MKKLMILLMSTMLVIGTLSITASASTTADVWDGTIATGFDGGTGTEDDPYEIATAAQLAYFSDAFTSSTGPDFEDAYVVLTNDIDLNNIEWTPIGSLYTSYFWGEFDGQGYTISNMQITVTASITYDMIGLFGVSEATIKNLVVEGEITSNAVGDAAYYGGIVGLQCGDMDNCISNVSLTFNEYCNTSFIGGVVGDLQGGFTISNCIYQGDINYLSSNAYGDTVIGGIAGSLYISTIDSCKNEGNITSYASIPEVGGIVGYAYTNSSGNVVISNCYNTGAITCYADASAAGIIAWITASSSEQDAYSVTVTNCFSSGELEGTSTNMGAIYSTTETSGFGKIIFENLYYLSTSVSDSPVANDDATSVTATDTADFLAQISEASGVDAWTTDSEGNVILVMELADYTAVEEAVTSIPEDLSVYTEDSVQVLIDAQEAVITGKLKSDQSTVDSYAEAIETAIAGLILKSADYTAVEEAIAKAEALDSSLYSNYSDVQAAIDAVIEGLDITEQATVDAYAAAIEAAIEGLEEVVEDELAADEVSPETGDISTTSLMFMLMLSSLFGIVYISRMNLNKLK